MEEGIRRILHKHPDALRYALSKASVELGRQRTHIFGLMGWTDFVDYSCTADPELVPRLVETVLETVRDIYTPDVETLAEMRESAMSAVLDLALCRYVDSTVGFFRDATAVGLLLNPAPLRSAQKQMSLDEILGFDSMDALIASLAVRRSDELSRDDFQLLTFCSDNLKMPVFVSDEDRWTVKTAIRTRNLLVHNGGRIDSRHVRALKLDDSLIDTEVELTDDLVMGWIEILGASTERVLSHLEEAWRHRFPGLTEAEGSSDSDVVA